MYEVIADTREPRPRTVRISRADSRQEAEQIVSQEMRDRQIRKHYTRLRIVRVWN